MRVSAELSLPDRFAQHHLGQVTTRHYRWLSKFDWKTQQNKEIRTRASHSPCSIRGGHFLQPGRFQPRPKCIPCTCVEGEAIEVFLPSSAPRAKLRRRDCGRRTVVI